MAWCHCKCKSCHISLKILSHAAAYLQKIYFRLRVGSVLKHAFLQILAGYAEENFTDMLAHQTTIWEMISGRKNYYRCYYYSYLIKHLTLTSLHGFRLIIIKAECHCELFKLWAAVKPSQLLCSFTKAAEEKWWQSDYCVFGWSTRLLHSLWLTSPIKNVLQKPQVGDIDAVTHQQHHHQQPEWVLSTAYWLQPADSWITCSKNTIKMCHIMFKVISGGYFIKEFFLLELDVQFKINLKKKSRKM